MYKIIKPFHSGFLQVSKLHSIYFEEVGNKSGVPIVFLHGGPGGEFKSKHKKIFNPKKFRVVFFDQRGCGKSKPFGELRENTTKDLIEDIEVLRKHLKINRWILYGRSWGSTLALLYAERYPQRVIQLILGGVALVRKQDEEWIYQKDRLPSIYPELWEKLTKITGSNVQEFIQNKILHGSEDEQKLATALFSYWEGNIMNPNRDDKCLNSQNITNEFIVGAKIYMFYKKHNYFIQNNQILNNIKVIKNIKTIIIQGRCDLLTPLYQAWELHKQLNNSIIDIVKLAGHSSSQSRIASRIKTWLDKI